MATNVLSEDATGCCRAIAKELLANPDLESWNCPECGMAWKPRLVAGMRYWEPHPIIEVFRGRPR